MSKSTDKRQQEIDKLLDDLLGPVEDWSTAEVDRVLVDAGIDVEATDRALFERVSNIAASYRQNNRDVPAPVTEFLQQMRPIDLPTHDVAGAKRSARKWIANLRRPTAGSAQPELAYSFRNKKDELTQKDRAAIDVLETKLRNRKRDEGV